MRVVSLRGRGLVIQEYSINNIIPVTYAGFLFHNIDALLSSPYQSPILPTFIDDTMVYYNKFTQDFMFFERDGVWNQETASHEKLSVEARFNEAEWIDKRTFVWNFYDET